MNITPVEVSAEAADFVFLGKIKSSFVRKRLHGFMPGERITIYQAKQPGHHIKRKLRSTSIDEVTDIFLDTNGTVLLGNLLLSNDETEVFAKNGGYKTAKQMFEQVRVFEGLPFEGQLITWL